MFDHKLRVLSEGLARGINRRDFLRKAGSAVFAGIASLAAGHALGGSAEAAKLGRGIPSTPRCTPPGPFCNLDGYNEPNGCHGAHCFQHRAYGIVMQCKVFYSYFIAGCWTVVDGGGYWTCCDCECTAAGGPQRATCGCAQFSLGPVPVPAGQS